MHCKGDDDRMLSWLIGAAVAYSAVKGGSKAIGEYGKNANPKLNNKNYDRRNGIDGIKVTGEKNIMNIAARNGIRTKDGVLPRYGYKNCLDYVRRYTDSDSDVYAFENEWKKVSEAQEKRQSRQLAMSSTNNYRDMVNRWEKNIWERNRTIILEFDHWYNLTLEEHKKQAMDINYHTYFGDIAVKHPVIRPHPKIYGKRTEYWEVKATKDAKQDEWLTKSTYKALYNQCCKYRGYKP